MNPPLMDPRTHPDWLPPHSIPWYEQVGRLNEEYAYPWRSSIAEPNGETIFTEKGLPIRHSRYIVRVIV